jgi:sirohydrochlorin ferrochelatase
MQALVLIAHGSRRAASNQEVNKLASRLQGAASGRFQLVETGFLEIASPSIPQAIETCIEAGATSLVIVPYFLAAGRHVAEDIPRIVEPLAQQHRHVTIHIAEHIGASASMSNLVLESANSIPVQGTDSALEQAG